MLDLLALLRRLLAAGPILLVRLVAAALLACAVLSLRPHSLTDAAIYLALAVLVHVVGGRLARTR